MAKKKSVPLPPEHEIRDEAISRIQKTLEPVTAKQVSGLLAELFKISEPVLTPILDDAVVKGLVLSIPSATAKGKPRYWDRDLVEFGRLQIENTIRKKGPLPIMRNSRRQPKGLNADAVSAGVQSLIDACRVREHPPMGTIEGLLGMGQNRHRRNPTSKTSENSWQKLSNN